MYLSVSRFLFVLRILQFHIQYRSLNLIHARVDALVSEDAVFYLSIFV
ncbi:Uncharacterised protein [Segatella copri]|nr:Uncharacterised protein [Segatella copri]